MSFRRSCSALVAASALVLACADNTPTAPTGPGLVSAAVSDAAARKGASLTSAIDQVIGGVDVEGTLRITRMTMSDAGQLLVSGVLTGTVNGAAVTQAFTDIPAQLTSGVAGSSGDEVVTMQGGDSCGILFLDLGPLFLDVLGLTVDLSQVVLDVSAVAGAGKLLGNLLCTVVHLLDGPAIITAIVNLLDRVNTLLSLLP